MAAIDPLSVPIDEAARERFKRAWLSGNPQPIEEFLPGEDRSEYLKTLEELVHIDLEFAWKAWAQGQEVLSDQRPAAESRPAAVEDYLRRFPRLRETAIVEQLLRHELRIRRACGDDVGESQRATSIGMFLDDSILSSGEPKSADRDEAARPAVSVEQFFAQLQERDLLPAAEVNELSQSLLHSEGKALTTMELAQELVRRKKLTAYQATTLYQGLGASLVLGNYVILEKLGQGGMGVVFQAQHRRLRRMAALKVLAPGLVKSADAVKRFQREVQAVARLDHPNIVAAHDADQAKGVHFLVMQFIEGTDLASYVKTHGPLPADKAVSCILQAAQGLEYAHRHGVIHRDVKPANLLLARDGTVKILDLGLARAEIEGESPLTELTNTGAILGTVDYMSPEQAMNTKLADQRADIYSLGASLWYLLAGRSMYGGRTLMERLMAHRERPVPSLVDQLAAGASSADRMAVLDSVFRKMVAKRPEDRYQSMTGVIADLTACITPGATPLSFNTGPSEETKLAEFLRQLKLEGGRGAARVTLGGTGTEPAATDQTLATTGPGSDTTARRSGSSANSASRGAGVSHIGASMGKHRRLLLGGGVAALVLIGLAVWSQTGGSGRPTPGNNQTNQSKATAASRNGAAKREGVTTPDERSDDPGLALAFDDRSSYVVCDIPLPADKPWTIEAWVRTPEEAQLLHNAPVITFGLRGTTQLFLKAYENSTRPSKAVDWEITGYAPGTKAGKRFIEPLLPNTWYHLAGIVDDQGLDIFVNGKRGAGAKAKLARKVPPSATRIGGAFSSILPPFRGLIDEVRVSSTIRYTADFTPQRRFTEDKDTLVLFHCDEGSGDKLVDSSGNSRHGHVVGAGWVDVNPPQRSRDFSLEFDGVDDHVEIPLPDVETGNSFTLEGFVELYNGPTEKTVPLMSWDGRPRINLGVNQQKGLAAASTDGKIVAHSSTTDFRTRQRLHMATVRQDSKMQLFLNGVPMPAVRPTTLQGNNIATLPEPTHVLALGAKVPLSDMKNTHFSFFSGTMDEVRVSRAARYSGPFTPPARHEPDADTIALYHCDEGAGDLLKDSSGNNRHGKIVGAKWVPAFATATPEFSLDFAHAAEAGLARVELPPGLNWQTADPITVEMVVTARSTPSKIGIDQLLWSAGGLQLKLYGARATFTASGIDKRYDAVADSQNQVIGDRTHLAAVSSGKQLWLFVNGRLGQTKPVTVTLPDKVYGSYIAGLPSSPHNHEPFDGLIHQVRISRGAKYTREFLPAAEMNAEPDTLALYRFKEGVGDVLNDSSGNNNHGKIVGAKWVTTNGTPEDLVRRAVERVFSRGGTVAITIGNMNPWFKSVKDIPPLLGPWKVIAVDLYKSSGWTDDDLAELLPLTNLTRLYLKGTQVSDAGLLLLLPQLEQLATLDVSSTKISAAGLQSIVQWRNLESLSAGGILMTAESLKLLAGLPKLQSLQLWSCRVTDEMARSIGELRQLRHLSIQRNTHITDQAIRHLRQLTELESLNLDGTRVTDACVDDLASLTKLQELNASSTGISRNGVARLQRALPDLKITTDAAADVDEPDGLDRLQPASPEMQTADRRAAEWVLSVGGRVTVLSADEGTRRIVTNPDFLPAGSFEVVGIDLNGNTSLSRERVSNDGLKNLSGLKSLKSLKLFQFKKISDAGFSQLADLPALETLDLTFTPVADHSADVIASFPELKTVWLGETQVGDTGIETLCRSLPSLDSLAIGSRVTVQGLRHLADAKHLKDVHNLKSGHLAAEGVLHLKKVPELESLNVVVATDAALRGVAELTQLRHLTLNLCKATPEGLRQLKAISGLEVLLLSDSSLIGDAHLTAVSELRSLKQLYLSNTTVTDKGVQILSGLINLEKLVLPKESVTPAAVALLQKSLPKCKVNLTR